MNPDQIYTLEGVDLNYIAAVIALAADNKRSVRVCVDGGLKVSVNQGMWTPPIGKQKA